VLEYVHPLAKSQSKVVPIITSMDLPIIAAHNPAARITRTKRKRLARKRIPIDVGNSVVERRRGVREAPDQLRGRGRVVLVVLGQAETVALVGDGLAVETAAAGQGLDRAGLVGAGDG